MIIDRKCNMETETELLMPVSVIDSHGVENASELLREKPPHVSFLTEGVARLTGKGAWVLLDYGRELCGGLRILTRTVECFQTRIRITLGESLTEACSRIGAKNATNDHSPRDFEGMLCNMSDLSFGQSGFRFARVELLEETRVTVRNIFATNTMPQFRREGEIVTSDEKLNRIIRTAAYTLKLCCQNGLIWDGIKRDRLVWSGDLNQEVITSLYFWGDNAHVRNSLDVLRQDTPAGSWINDIPAYSAWWVVNLCDYCRITGNRAYFDENREYALEILRRLNHFVAEDGTIDFRLPPEDYMVFFLDWPSYRTEDAVIGTACLIRYAALLYRSLEENSCCDILIRKLARYIEEPCRFKQTRAFQILAGRREPGDGAFLEENGAEGMSTFMSYYILRADALAGGERMLDLIRQYFGAMLDRGATTFWEDFHLEWLEGSGRIDALPEPGQKDLHGDYGDFCYRGFRHSLCHGWAGGVLAYLIEDMIGLKMENGRVREIHPHAMGVAQIRAKLPLKDGWLILEIENGKIQKWEETKDL